jgi:hypothetical protein
MRPGTEGNNTRYNPRIASRAETATRTLLILCFFVAMYLQHTVGLADNCDFSRLMHWISTGPVGIEPNWPASGTEEWARRFANYWIPYWKLEWKMGWPPPTSAVLLWLPGALLNSFLYSNKVLYLPVLSLFPKLALFGVLLLLLKWIERKTRHRTVFLFTLGVPVILLLTTTDYVAYLNSFYRESASFVFLFVLFATILILKQQASIGYLLASLATILLLATTKPSMVYWPLVALPFVFYIWHSKKNGSLRTTIAACFVLVFVFTLVSTFVSTVRPYTANPYHSLFYGALTFSDNPSAHLRRLDMEDAAHCVNIVAYSRIGAKCHARYGNRMSFKNTLLVFYREPVVMFRTLKHVLAAMQNISLAPLGKYSFDDPRSQAGRRNEGIREDRFRMSTAETMPLNLWAALKFRFFPTGYALLVTLVVFAGWFTLNLRGTDFYQESAIIGLMSTIACTVDMAVAILGEGKADLIKHLFLANVLFDIAAIAFLNMLLARCFQFIEKRLSKSNPHKTMA